MGSIALFVLALRIACVLLLFDTGAQMHSLALGTVLLGYYTGSLIWHGKRRQSGAKARAHEAWAAVLRGG